MTGYGDSHYGSEWYLASPYRVGGVVLRASICARIIKPISSVPPVIDTISVGLAQRFDWLQQGIQAFALFNKIEYARGTDLDDNWGKIYDLPRLSGEGDDDYRARLKNYVRVLTGSGTIPNTQAVLDSLLGLPGGTEISSRWPAQVMIGFTSIDAMRRAKARRALIDSVLPGMFAAGVDYEMRIPFMDVAIRAAILGEAEREILIRAAIATQNELSCGLDALVAYSRALKSALKAAICTTRTTYLPIRAAVLAERLLEPSIMAAVQGDPSLTIEIGAAVQGGRELPISCRAAVMGEPELQCSHMAAIARTFEAQCNILARIVCMYSLSSGIVAGIRTTRELSMSIRARIAKAMPPAPETTRAGFDFSEPDGSIYLGVFC